VLQATDMTLTLIGPIEHSAAVQRLARFDNFHHVAALQGDALKREMDRHDILVMPYDTTQAGVRASSAPNKLFQYLACAKPIVIADMPQLTPLPDHFVYRADSAAAFVRAIRQASADDSRDLRQARLDFARRNTWDARGDQIRALLQSLSIKEPKT
jgi:glycosyltransferase involved in cell wall biosynthesis